MPNRSYRNVRYRYCCTEFTEVSGTVIDVVPKVPEVSGTGIHVVVTEVSGTGIDVIPNLPKFQVR